jgi:mevalonate kinase
MPALISQAPAKTILFGEHAAVYGFPAIAVPLNSLNLKVSFLAKPDQPQGTWMIRNKDTEMAALLSELPESDPVRKIIQFTASELNVKQLPAAEILISSTIPVASGLGSSAALAVALIRGASQFLGFHPPPQRISELAFEMEKIQHGNPSGIDNSVIAFNQAIFFIKDQSVEFLTFKSPFTIVLANTGIHSLTREVVGEVRSKREYEPERIDALLSEIGQISLKAREKLVQMDLEAVGSLMNENHTLLQQLGVSCPELDRLVDTARRTGALGAKLCGSGKGGNMVALTTPERAETLRKAFLAAGAVQAIAAEVK